MSDVNMDLLAELGMDVPPQQPIAETFDPETQTRELHILKRALKVKQARRLLIPFAELGMPTPKNPDDSDETLYDTQAFHAAIASAMERCADGKIKRLIITTPPRMGKTELAVHRNVAWLMGRDPTRQIIVGTYNDTFAEDHGKKIRAIMTTKIYKQIFPACEFVRGGEASDRLATTQGGLAMFVGRGSATTGRGAHVFIIDDPIKDRIEANSEGTRQTVWEWLHDVVKTRLMDEDCVIILIMTRWHEDDLVGRLTDPDNPHYIAEEAALWSVINLPALAEDNDPLGRKVGEALWPKQKNGKPKFSVEYLERLRRANPRTFSALYQQRPSPEDGTYYTRDMLRYYKSRADLPRGMRIYAASDHAVGTKQSNDKTCLLVVGVDNVNDIWLIDCLWSHMGPKEAIANMIKLAKIWHPIIWWAESGHIQKSIGPFLRDQQRLSNTWFSVSPIIPSADKVQRAQSSIGLMSMGRFKFPAWQSWCTAAVDELLKFNNGTRDDFVDTLSLIGLGLNRIVKGSDASIVGSKPSAPRIGTLRWVKYASDQEKRNRVSNIRRAA
jgi:predicted phage terminase large subunit-like protein